MIPARGEMMPTSIAAASYFPRRAALVALLAAFLIPLPAVAAQPAGTIPEALAPELILVNGKVMTLDDADRVVEAVAIKAGRIVSVGSNQTIRELAGGATRVLDVGGRLVLPGLVDAHSHSTGVPPDYPDPHGRPPHR